MPENCTANLVGKMFIAVGNRP